MRYSEIRGSIKTGDLLGFSHTATGSWYDFQVHMVRKATESEFSHVGIAFVVYDRVFVLEAVGSGVRLFPLSRALPFYLISNPTQLSDRALEFAFSQLGAKYENKFMMVLADIFSFKQLDSELKNNHRFQCSEYVNAILHANGQFLTSIDTPGAIMGAGMRDFGSLHYIM